MKKIVITRLSILFFGLLLLSCTKKDDSPTTPEEGGPDITSFSPTSGPVGTEIFITGKNFGSTVAANTVKIGTTTATVSSASTTELFITVPDGATTGKISVTVNGKTDTGGTFTVTQDEESTGIVLNKNQLTLFTLDSETLSIVSGNDDNASITWGTNDENIAKVDDNGKITGISEGTTIITATVGDNNVAALVHVKPSVYVVGTENDDSIRSSRLWKNGIPYNIGGVEAFSIFTTDTDIFIAGYGVGQDVNDLAMLWKNGELSYLNDGTKSAQAFSVFVNNNDVYIAGYVDNEGINIATLWKNGESINLSDGSNNAIAYSVYVNELGVYIGGFDDRVAKVWKLDGNTTSYEEINETGITSIFVSESDVYAAGYELNGNTFIGKVWKNGALLYNLTDGTKNAGITSLYVNHTDIYAVGFERNQNDIDVAKIWKNGILNDNLSDGSNNARAHSVCVHKDNIYVAGYDGSVAKVWKNGVITNLNVESTSARANSIFVK